MGKYYKHLNRTKRIHIEALNNAGLSAKEIAEEVGVHISTIYRELKRGEYEKINTELITCKSYSSDLAQMKYEENLRAKGGDLKIGNDIGLAEYIENKILNEKYSPGAVIGSIKRDHLIFSVTLSKSTIYSYIDKGIFMHLSNKDLPVKRNKKNTNYKKIHRMKRDHAGTSIEARPEYIDTRETVGHWEMDTVVGKRGVSKHSLLVLTERKTRKEIVRLLHSHTATAVVEALDNLEILFGSNFSKIFKTITVDNGTEFSDSAGIARSVLHPGKRLDVYYCHPYSSYERGSNEVTNKLIRRHVPKGTDFDDLTEKDVSKIEKWINDYPREKFGWKTADELFNAEFNMAV